MTSITLLYRYSIHVVTWQCSGWYMVDRYVVSCTAIHRVHRKSIKWLYNDLCVGNNTRGEFSRHCSRWMSCLGHLVIDTLVGMDKDSSSGCDTKHTLQLCFKLLWCCFGNAMIISRVKFHGWKSTSNHWPPTKGKVPNACVEGLVTNPWAWRSAVWRTNHACIGSPLWHLLWLQSGLDKLRGASNVATNAPIVKTTNRMHALLWNFYPLIYMIFSLDKMVHVQICS